MANLKQSTITGSGETSLLVSGSSIVMPSMSGSVDSGSAAQMYIDITPGVDGLKLHLTQVGSYGTSNSPYSCLGAWSAGGALALARHALAGAGTQDAGLVFGGRYSPGVNTNCTEEYNGSTWAAGGNLGTARYGTLGSAGTQTAGLVFGGETPSTTANTEEYNGTSWAEQNNLP